MTAETWTPSRLRDWVRDRFAAGGPGTIAWIAAQHRAGMTIAVYECPVTSGNGQRGGLLVPVDHCWPPETLPFTGGTVSWPAHLVAICRPESGNAVVVPIAAAMRR